MPCIKWLHVYRSRLIRMAALTRTFTQSQGPQYVLSDKRDGYEVRSYKESKWIATTVMGTSWKAAIDAGVGNLLDYFARSGKNQTGTSSAIIPVVTKIVPGEGPVCHSTFEVMLADPPALSSDSDASVKVVVMPPMTAYVAQYSGPVSDQIMIDEAERLTDALSRDGVSVSDAHYYTTTYGTVSQEGGIAMDVWFVAK